ncbi:MAG: hypothetical protein LC650_01000 [Actinobacteria bacterium]|nr:hypothetical protein [Actinomycetota bacterium]
MNELTEEGYKIEVLKARISRLVANYEEEIANYQVALQRARQELDAQSGEADVIEA